MRIAALKLTNFQSHAGLEIIPHDRLTAIVGRSDLGKSAIVRALRWVLLNEPAGTQFIKEGTPQCTVRVVLRDPDLTLTRVRSRQGVNRYILERPNEPTLTLDAVGKEVPEPVRAALGIDLHADVGRSGSSLNFAIQKEPPFLIGFTPAERTALLQLLSGDVLDRAAKQLSADVRTETSERKSAAARHVTLTETHEREVAAHANLSVSLESAEQWYTCLNEILQSLERLQALRARLVDLRSSVHRLEKQRAGYAGIDLRACAETIMSWTPFLDRVLDLQKLARRKAALQGKVEQIEVSIRGWSRQDQEASSLLSEYRQQLQVCPACNRPF